MTDSSRSIPSRPGWRIPIQLNQIVDRGITTALTRRFGLSSLATLSMMPELAPIIDIDGDQELQYALGWRTFTVAFGAAALAANALKLQFQNPNPVVGNNGILILLEEITVVSTAADGFMIGFPGILNNAALTTAIVTHGIVDGRMKTVAGAQPGGMALVSAAQSASVFGLVGQNARAYGIAANIPFTIPGRPYVLVPGTTILMGFQGNNLQQVISLTWRERVLNDQENAS